MKICPPALLVPLSPPTWDLPKALNIIQVSQLLLSEVNINSVVSQKNGNESLTYGHSRKGISTHIPAGRVQRMLRIEKPKKLEDLKFLSEISMIFHSFSFSNFSIYLIMVEQTVNSNGLSNKVLHLPKREPTFRNFQPSTSEYPCHKQTHAKIVSRTSL